MRIFRKLRDRSKAYAAKNEETRDASIKKTTNQLSEPKVAVQDSTVSDSTHIKSFLIHNSGHGGNHRSSTGQTRSSIGSTSSKPGQTAARNRDSTTKKTHTTTAKNRASATKQTRASTKNSHAVETSKSNNTNSKTKVSHGHRVPIQKQEKHRDPTRTRIEKKKSVSKPQSSSRAPQPDSSSGIPFEELYRLKSVLGQGAFSTVREAKHKNDPYQTYAVKCMERSKMSRDDEEALVDEIGILRELDHSAIICLYDCFQDPKMYYLVMEQMLGGELFDRIVAKSYYNEREARDVCKILLEAVGYCHSNNVAHRDLKPENLLLVSQSDDYKVKIADFGFAKRVIAPKSLSTQCGTPGYVAPEILEGRKYDTKADMWSVGVILYILLGGYPPFIENVQRLLFRKIRKGQYEFHEEYWGSISDDAKKLIASLLNIDPNTRLSASEALQNKWITSDAKTLEGKDLGTNLEELIKFNAKRKFKAAVKSIVAVNKLSSLGMNFSADLDD